MKVESGVVTSTALQKITVKEEKEECCGFQQKRGTSSTSTATTTITTITITTDLTTNNTPTKNTTTVTTSGATSIVTPLMTSVVHPTPLICQSPLALKSSLNNNNTEPFPIDLDLKSKSKGEFSFCNFFLFNSSFYCN